MTKLIVGLSKDIAVMTDEELDRILEEMDELRDEVYAEREERYNVYRSMEKNK